MTRPSGSSSRVVAVAPVVRVRPTLAEPVVALGLPLPGDDPAGRVHDEGPVALDAADEEVVLVDPVGVVPPGVAVAGVNTGADGACLASRQVRLLDVGADTRRPLRADALVGHLVGRRVGDGPVLVCAGVDVPVAVVGVVVVQQSTVRPQREQFARLVQV
jgi:hypothetical protein